MKILGAIVATLFLLLFIAWWLGMSLSYFNKAITTSRGGEAGSSRGPVEYSRQKVQEVNEIIVDFGEEVERAFP